MSSGVETMARHGSQLNPYSSVLNPFNKCKCNAVYKVGGRVVSTEKFSAAATMSALPVWLALLSGLATTARPYDKYQGERWLADRSAG